MRSFFQALRLYTLVTWVGGLLFFAFTLAPAAFHTLPVHEAGLVVGATLPILQRTGFACGILFLLASTRLGRKHYAQTILIAAMLVLTLYIQNQILPHMDRDRVQAGGDIAAAAPDNPARVDFDRLHKQSEQVEGTVLLLGLVVIGLVAAEPQLPRSS